MVSASPSRTTTSPGPWGTCSSAEGAASLTSRSSGSEAAAWRATRRQEATGRSSRSTAWWSASRATPSLFTFVPNSAGRIGIVIGDGRKGIESAAPGSFDLVVLDAFSSDAVPAHLLTAEAIDAYLSRIRPGGLVVLHISNRYLDLEPVIGRLASDRGLAALTNRNVDIPAADAARGRTASQWVVIAPDPSLLTQVRSLPGWRPLAQKDGVYAWTDDYSNLLHSIRWN